jgi:hypothetical protein
MLDIKAVIIVRLRSQMSLQFSNLEHILKREESSNLCQTSRQPHCQTHGSEIEVNLLSKLKIGNESDGARPPARSDPASSSFPLRSLETNLQRGKRIRDLNRPLIHFFQPFRTYYGRRQTVVVRLAKQEWHYLKRDKVRHLDLGFLRNKMKGTKST